MGLWKPLLSRLPALLAPRPGAIWWSLKPPMRARCGYSIRKFRIQMPPKPKNETEEHAASASFSAEHNSPPQPGAPPHPIRPRPSRAICDYIYVTSVECRAHYVGYVAVVVYLSGVLFRRCARRAQKIVDAPPTTHCAMKANPSTSLLYLRASPQWSSTTLWRWTGFSCVHGFLSPSQSAGRAKESIGKSVSEMAEVLVHVS